MWYDAYWGSVSLTVSNLSPKKLKQYETNLEFQNIFNRWYNAALNTFKWRRLPDTMDERMIERAALLSGKWLGGEVSGSLLSLIGAPASGWTLYGYPANAYGWGFNGFNKEFNVFVPGADESRTIKQNAGGISYAGKPNACMGYDNSNGYPYINYLITECHRLANIKMAMDVLAENLKQPLIISCDDTAVNSVREAMKNRQDNLPYIISTGKLPIDNFKIWDTKVSPESLTAFKDLYEWNENKLRELFGLNADAQNDKKERLLVDEINSNNDVIMESVDKRLVWRERWADQMNELFGTNISVELRNKPNDNMEDIPEEGDEEDVDEQRL